MPVSKELAERCLTTLYRIITSRPEALTDDAINVLSGLVRQEPRKCLIIIKSYIDRMDDLENPWGVISILNEKINHFIKSEIGPQYVSLLFHLFETYQDLKENQLDFYISEFIGYLQDKKIKDQTLVCIYRFLTYLCTDIELDDETTALHLSKKNVQKSVCNLLLHVNVELGPKTIKQLSSIKVHTAAYALLKFAISRNDHSNLVNYGYWLEDNQISAALKLRLFLAVLLDRKCRAKFSLLPQTVDYLSMLIDSKEGEVLKMISTCVRRLVSKDSLENFQRVNFFSKYWNTVLELNDKNVISAGIMCIDKLVKSGYLQDINVIIPTMKDVINLGGGVGEQAIKIIANCSQYPECIPTLKKNRFPKYFQKLKKTHHFTKECAQFEKNIQ